MVTLIGLATSMGRFTEDTDRLLVAAVDGLLIAALAIAGRAHHGYPILGQPLETIETAIPFLLGWLLLSIPAGAYARNTLTSPRAAARVTLVAWLAAANVGLLVRSAPFFTGGTAWPFPLVMTGTGLVVLVAWRLVNTAISKK
ncbi:DUF3054 domain-containing protein [Halobacteria archaeon AArc-curdl1]|uniref:DUF3054 domain-containing protein n=1 Tax=Natronosalvus hydrolyticus TaxID=2979988 RepID=A0AAP2Z4B8_9EURY|nr:DUF3054 domain-containing protein [Halobacteria archaeon AArc-curdl1]